MHKGNIAVFVTKTGTLIDKGAKELADLVKLPNITDITLNQALRIKSNSNVFRGDCV